LYGGCGYTHLLEVTNQQATTIAFGGSFSADVLMEDGTADSSMA